MTVHRVGNQPVTQPGALNIAAVDHELRQLNAARKAWVTGTSPRLDPGTLDRIDELLDQRWQIATNPNG